MTEFWEWPESRRRETLLPGFTSQALLITWSWYDCWIRCLWLRVAGFSVVHVVVKAVRSLLSGPPELWTEFHWRLFMLIFRFQLFSLFPFSIFFYFLPFMVYMALWFLFNKAQKKYRNLLVAFLNISWKKIKTKYRILEGNSWLKVQPQIIQQAPKNIDTNVKTTYCNDTSIVYIIILYV